MDEKLVELYAIDVEKLEKKSDRALLSANESYANINSGNYYLVEALIYELRALRYVLTIKQ